MTSRVEKIPFQIDISRVIEVLATQIYQTPLALLRENTQNAFDAILLRRHLAQDFEPSIEISVTPGEIRVSDNGIGMTADDLRNHYWRARGRVARQPGCSRGWCCRHLWDRCHGELRHR